MSTRLIQIVTFSNVAPAATVALAHNINVNGTPEKPDYVATDVAGFTVAVTASTVTVTNTTAFVASVNVWLELKHSIPRQLGGGVDNLTPQPFIAAGGAGGGGGSTVIIQDGGAPLPNNPFTTLNFVGPGVTATDAGGGVASVLVPAAPNTLIVKDEGSGVAGGPFTAINFVGAGVTATNGGAGTATVTIPGAAPGGNTILVRDENVPVAGGPFTTLNFSGETVVAFNAGGGVAQVSMLMGLPPILPVVVGPATVAIQVGKTHYLDAVSPGNIVTLTLPAASLYPKGELFAIVNTTLNANGRYDVQPLPGDTADGLGAGVAAPFTGARNSTLWTSDGANGWWIVGARGF